MIVEHKNKMHTLSFTLNVCVSFLGHLSDHPPECDPVDDGAEDLVACYPIGRAAQIRGEELLGAG